MEEAFDGIPSCSGTANTSQVDIVNIELEEFSQSKSNNSSRPTSSANRNSSDVHLQTVKLSQLSIKNNRDVPLRSEMDKKDFKLKEEKLKLEKEKFEFYKQYKLDKKNGKF